MTNKEKNSGIPPLSDSPPPVWEKQMRQTLFEQPAPHPSWGEPPVPPYGEDRPLKSCVFCVSEDEIDAFLEPLPSLITLGPVASEFSRKVSHYFTVPIGGDFHKDFHEEFASLLQEAVSGEQSILTLEEFMLAIQRSTEREPGDVLGLCDRLLWDLQFGNMHGLNGVTTRHRCKARRMYLDYLYSLVEKCDFRDTTNKAWVLGYEQIRLSLPYAIAATLGPVGVCGRSIGFSDIDQVYRLLQDDRVRMLMDERVCFEAVAHLWSLLRWGPSMAFETLFCVMLAEERDSILSWLCDVIDFTRGSAALDRKVVMLLAADVLRGVNCLVWGGGVNVAGTSFALHRLQALYHLPELYELTCQGTADITSAQFHEWDRAYCISADELSDNEEIKQKCEAWREKYRGERTCSKCIRRTFIELVSPGRERCAAERECEECKKNNSSEFYPTREAIAEASAAPSTKLSKMSLD